MNPACRNVRFLAKSLATCPTEAMETDPWVGESLI